MPTQKTPIIFQCDGGGDENDESSSEDGDTSETSVDTSNDEDESEESSEETEAGQEKVSQRKTRKNAPTSAETERGRLTRQKARDQMPTKRLLRSRKTSPVAGAGSRQPQIFPCPNCKKEFNCKSSVNRHIRWCKPKTTKSPKKKGTEKDDKGKGNKTPNSAKKSIPASGEPSSLTPEGNGVKRGRGRPKKNSLQSTPTNASVTASNLMNNTNSFTEEHIPEDDFMLQRSPESSPGIPDTSSESDYEQREFAANAHHLNSDRNRGISIDVENPDMAYQQHFQPNSHHPTIMELGQQEMRLPVEGPITCQKCGMTYRTRQGYENHFPSCRAYSSSEEDEDEEVDVVDDEANNTPGPSWRQNQNNLPRTMQSLQNDLKLAEMQNTLKSRQVEESSEEVESSEENESQANGVLEDEQAYSERAAPHTGNSNFTGSGSGELGAGSQGSEKIVSTFNNEPVIFLPVDTLAMTMQQNEEKLKAQNLASSLPLSSQTQEQMQRQLPNNFPAQIPSSQPHNLVPVPSQQPPPPDFFSSQMQQFIQIPPHLQGQPNQLTSEHPHQVQYNFPPNLSTTAPPSAQLLHHAQASNNTPTYTQAQLMPGTLLHSSAMQAQQQMSTSAAPPSEYNQPGNSQPQPQPQPHPTSSNIPQLLMNNNNSGSQPFLRVQNNGVQSLNGSFQLSHQLQGVVAPPTSASQAVQQQQIGAFANVQPQNIQHQILRNGSMMDHRLQTSSVSNLPQQFPSHPQQMPLQFQGQSGFPNQFHFPNGNGTMPAYNINVPQQTQQLSQQIQPHQPQQLPQVINQPANIPNQLQQSIPVPNPNVNLMEHQQQIMVQQEQQNSMQSNAVSGTQFQQHQQQGAMQFQYCPQSIPKLLPNPNANNDMSQHSQQQVVQQGLNNQQQNMGSGPTHPTLPYQIQQPTQPPLAQNIAMFQQQQQHLHPQTNPNGHHGQQLNAHVLQSGFQNQLIQSAPPSHNLQQQQMNSLQLQQQLFQMQQANQSQAPHLQGAPNDPPKTPIQPQPQLPNQGFVMNVPGAGFHWNKQGMQLMNSQQQQMQFQRPHNSQQPPPESVAGPQQHQFQGQGGQLQQPSSASQQQITQVIQQIITDGSGNTYIIVAPSPAQTQQQTAGIANGGNANASTSSVLNLLPGLQNVQCAQQSPAVQQQSSQSTHCVLQAGVNGANQAASHGQGVTPPGSAGRSGPCPCPSCKEKLGTGAVNAMDKFKKVLPYPSAALPSHSPTDQLKPILPNLGGSTRPILIRPAGTKPVKTVRIQKGVPENSLQQQQNTTPPPFPPQPQQVSPMRVLPLPLAMKMIMPGSAPTSTAILQQQPTSGLGAVIDGNNPGIRGGVPTPSPNIAVVRPMENPLQKLTDQISQIETTFMTPSPHPQQPMTPPTVPQQHQASPQPQQQIVQQQAVASPGIVQQPIQLPQGPHLTLVTASPPPQPIQAGVLASPNHLHQLVTLSPRGSPIQQPSVSPALQNLQPRLMLVDHGCSASSTLSTPSKPSTPTPTATTPVRTGTMAGVKRKLPGTPESASSPDSSNKSIKVTLKRKEGGDSYSINRISGSASASGTMKSLKIKGQIKSGEQAGTSTDVVVVPCIHTVPVPDPEADDAGGNPTIAEDASGTAETSGSGEHNNEVKSSNGRLLHRAVIVYEVQSNETVLFRSSDVKAVWGYIFETVQGSRLNHNLPPLPYPATNISLPHNDPEADAAFNKLGLTHRAVQFLLEQLPGMKALSAPKQLQSGTQPSPTQPSLPPTPSKQLSTPNEDPSENKVGDEDEPLQENASGCTRTERFRWRKAFDMFGWLASKHRNSSGFSGGRSMESATSLAAPLNMRYRKLKERKDYNLTVCRSEIHGRGLYTKRDIEKGEMIIEYTGELIRPTVCDIRERYYGMKSMGCYMFRINNDLVIDATMKGNAARFINHSCEPNCQAKTLKISENFHILIFALRRIKNGEELTYDYKFEKEEEKIPCSCRSKHCRKYLN